jgi:glycosyltransferase involved in cell wall biosynthesis
MNIAPTVIDVICPVYNHAKFIDQCIKSILDQEEVFVIIHLIDDASTDESSKIIKDFSQKNPAQIKGYYNQINYGNAVSSIAANELDLKGEYWTYIEGDDFLLNSRKFILQIERLREDKKLIATATRCVFWDTRKDLKDVIKPDLIRWNFYDLLTKKSVSKMYCHISSIVWKNETHRIRHHLSPLKKLRTYESESEVFLVHKILKESKKYIEFQDIEGSCYRYTGSGIWSGLDQESQETINRNLEINIDLIIPTRFKFKMKLINYFFNPNRQETCTTKC